MGIEVTVQDIFAVVYHEYDFGPILLLAYNCALADKDLLPCGDGLLWAKQEDLSGLDFAPADRPVVEKIIWSLRAKRKDS